MSTLEDTNASVDKLSADLKAFIAANSGGANDADLAALKAKIDGLDALVAPPAPPA